MNQNGRLARSGEGLLQVLLQTLVRGFALVVLDVFDRRGIGNREIVVAALKIARETFVEHDKFRTLGMGRMILRPMRGDLARERGVAGKDQDDRAICTHRRFLARQNGPQLPSPGRGV